MSSRFFCNLYDTCNELNYLTSDLSVFIGLRINSKFIAYVYVIIGRWNTRNRKEPIQLLQDLHSTDAANYGRLELCGGQRSWSY